MRYVPTLECYSLSLSSFHPFPFRFSYSFTLHSLHSLILSLLSWFCCLVWYSQFTYPYSLCLLFSFAVLTSIPRHSRNVESSTWPLSFLYATLCLCFLLAHLFFFSFHLMRCVALFALDVYVCILYSSIPFWIFTSGIFFSGISYHTY